ncbi:hypothetical protein OG417_47745 [Actinoallomurus sp. NBC_01490]|uniref:hypothetical protein n=1 Tax=Actinoallomurus sp. NBC_01490 TaxID=2903557 RepID=UPI002E31D270|nr:hypothetical protein [Actinoallomurus sp. NBC_01490]
MLDLLAKEPDRRPVGAAAVRDFLRRSGHTATSPPGPPRYLRPVERSQEATTVTASSVVEAPKIRKGLVAAAVGGVLAVALAGAGAFALLNGSGGAGAKAKTTPHASSTGVPMLRPVGENVPGQARAGDRYPIGRMAIVPVIHRTRTDAVGVTVTSLGKGSKADLAGLALNGRDRTTPRTTSISR